MGAGPGPDILSLRKVGLDGGVPLWVLVLLLSWYRHVPLLQSILGYDTTELSTKYYVHGILT